MHTIFHVTFILNISKSLSHVLTDGSDTNKGMSPTLQCNG